MPQQQAIWPTRLGRARRRGASWLHSPTRLGGVERLVVTGRGYSFPSALETALKLMETSYVAAQAFSGADLMHGPMAMLQESSAVLAFVNHGTGGRAMQPVLQRLRELDDQPHHHRRGRPAAARDR